MAVQSQRSLKIWVCPQNYAVSKKKDTATIFRFDFCHWISLKTYLLARSRGRFGKSPHFLLDLFCETFPHGIRKVTLRANDWRGSLIRNYDLKNSHPSTHPCFHHVVQEVHGSGDKLPRDAKYHQAFSPALVTPGLLKWSFQVRMIMLTRRQGRW